MRALASFLSLLALALLAGCAGRGQEARNRAAVLGRPGDATRGSILALHDRYGERRASTSVDPLPALARSDLCSEPLDALQGDAGAGVYPLRAPQRSPLLGRWRLAGHGDVTLPLDGAWRVRVGLSAGGAPPESVLSEPGRWSEHFLVPGVRLERDL